MGNKDYENYNRSYSSKDYQSNTEEHRFGQDISNNTFGYDFVNFLYLYVLGRLIRRVNESGLIWCMMRKSEWMAMLQGILTAVF